MQVSDILRVKGHSLITVTPDESAARMLDRAVPYVSCMCTARADDGTPAAATPSSMWSTEPGVPTPMVSPSETS